MIRTFCSCSTRNMIVRPQNARSQRPDENPKLCIIHEKGFSLICMLYTMQHLSVRLFSVTSRSRSRISTIVLLNIRNLWQIFVQRGQSNVQRPLRKRKRLAAKTRKQRNRRDRADRWMENGKTSKCKARGVTVHWPVAQTGSYTQAVKSLHTKLPVYLDPD